MERYESLFAQLKERKEGALVPLVTFGDPGIEQSLEIISTLIGAGVDALESGIPFSGPLADGLTIQDTTLCVLVAGVILVQYFGMLALIRWKRPTIPIGLLIHADLVFNKGIDELYAQCEKVGADSALTADAPAGKSVPFRQTALRHSVVPILICPPSADGGLLRQIASYSRGYTYLPSRTGMTGAEDRATSPFNYLIVKLKEYNAAPSLQGFGIPAPDQVEVATNAGVAGVISGSTVVKIIEQHINEPEKILMALKVLV